MFMMGGCAVKVASTRSQISRATSAVQKADPVIRNRRSSQKWPVINMDQLNMVTTAAINKFEAEHPRILPDQRFRDREVYDLQRAKRSTSCFTHEKIMKFRKAFHKIFNSRMTYKQMKQLIDNHSICMNGICIACGENYVYSFEARHR